MKNATKLILKIDENIFREIPRARTCRGQRAPRGRRTRTGDRTQASVRQVVTGFIQIHNAELIL